MDNDFKGSKIFYNGVEIASTDEPVEIKIRRRLEAWRTDPIMIRLEERAYDFPKGSPQRKSCRKSIRELIEAFYPKP